VAQPNLNLSVELLENLYSKYNSFDYIHPDPLELLYNYNDLRDREVVALIASSLAYGRVGQILKSTSRVLNLIGSPGQFVLSSKYSEIVNRLAGFKHRFSTGQDMAQLLLGAGRIIETYGSLENCFVAGLGQNDHTVVNALKYFADKLTDPFDNKYSSLIPDPKKGSACKRMNLMLRWLVRKDQVDPGGWLQIDPAKLIIPLDTHMHRIAVEYGLTGRKSADMQTALEITNAFTVFSPGDPVRYDFALTRPAIGGH